MAVTLEGPLLLVQAALSALERANGTIINIGGLTAYTGAARRAHVVTAKAGLDGLTKALAVELAARDITVNLVAPGLIDTERDGPEPRASQDAHHAARSPWSPGGRRRRGPLSRGTQGALSDRPDDPRERRRVLAVAKAAVGQLRSEHLREGAERSISASAHRIPRACEPRCFRARRSDAGMLGSRTPCAA